MLGDSDSAPDSEFRRTTLEDYLEDDPDLSQALGWRLELVNRAQNCTSAAETGCSHDGVTQTSRALQAVPDTRIAVIRYGLNDAHFYLGTPTPEAVTKFRSAYQEIVELVVAHSAIPVGVAIQGEEDDAYDGGRAAINEAIEDLVEGYGLFVDPRISWGQNRNLFAPDGTHLDDDGQQVVAAAVEAALLDYLRTPLE